MSACYTIHPSVYFILPSVGTDFWSTSNTNLTKQPKKIQKIIISYKKTKKWTAECKPQILQKQPLCIQKIKMRESDQIIWHVPFHQRQKECGTDRKCILPKNNTKNLIKRRQEMDLWGGKCTENWSMKAKIDFRLKQKKNENRADSSKRKTLKNNPPTFGFPQINKEKNRERHWCQARVLVTFSTCVGRALPTFRFNQWHVCNINKTKEEEGKTKRRKENSPQRNGKKTMNSFSIQAKIIDPQTTGDNSNKTKQNKTKKSGHTKGKIKKTKNPKQN